MISIEWRPVHSFGQDDLLTFELGDCSDCFRLERIAGWASHPLESAAFSRHTSRPIIHPDTDWPRKMTYPEAEACPRLILRNRCPYSPDLMPADVG